MEVTVFTNTQNRKLSMDLWDSRNKSHHKLLAGDTLKKNQESLTIY